MGYDAGRPAGAWVREQSNRRTRQIAVGFAIFFPTAAVFIALAIGHALSIVGSALFLALILLFRPFANAYIDDHFRLHEGTLAEEAVGNTIDELIREGWIPIHDQVLGPEGNIDHIVSGPGGVFLIETKTRRYDNAHLGRVKWQAKKLHDELGVWVTPVICLHRRDGAPFKHKGVHVVPHKHLSAWLRAQRNAVLPFERLARFADSL